MGCILQACNGSSTRNIVKDTSAAAEGNSPFGGELPDYWYRGEAEITTYDLRQARYGELREGTAVLIQVSEPFLAEKQVKSNTGLSAPGRIAERPLPSGKIAEVLRAGKYP